MSASNNPAVSKDKRQIEVHLVLDAMGQPIIPTLLRKSTM